MKLSLKRIPNHDALSAQGKGTDSTPELGLLLMNVIFSNSLLTLIYLHRASSIIHAPTVTPIRYFLALDTNPPKRYEYSSHASPLR